MAGRSFLTRQLLTACRSPSRYAAGSDKAGDLLDPSTHWQSHVLTRRHVTPVAGLGADRRNGDADAHRITFDGKGGARPPNVGAWAIASATWEVGSGRRSWDARGCQSRWAVPRDAEVGMQFLEDPERRSDNSCQRQECSIPYMHKNQQNRQNRAGRSIAACTDCELRRLSKRAAHPEHFGPCCGRKLSLQERGPRKLIRALLAARVVACSPLTAISAIVSAGFAPVLGATTGTEPSNDSPGGGVSTHQLSTRWRRWRRWRCQRPSPKWTGQDSGRRETG